MIKQANPTVIGGFVLGALALFVGALILFGSGAVFRERVAMVTFFPGSVQGLAVGAAVTFEGVSVGRVTSIELRYDPLTDSFSVPVFYEVWPDIVWVVGERRGVDPEQVLRSMVRENGLHARLESMSFVTGQYMIALQFAPGRESPLVGYEGAPIEVPALEAMRDRVSVMLNNLRVEELVDELVATFSSVRKLIEADEFPRLVSALERALLQAESLLQELNEDVWPLASRVDETLEEYAALAETLRLAVGPLAENLQETTGEMSRMMRQVNEQVGPVSASALRTLQETESAMRQLSALASDVGTTRARLDQFLTEASGTARALRSFADQLDRHPEALLRGRR